MIFSCGGHSVGLLRSKHLSHHHLALFGVVIQKWLLRWKIRHHRFFISAALWFRSCACGICRRGSFGSLVPYVS